MQVILLDKIRNLGNLGDSLKVKSGYARNFLIPQGKAVFSNKENIERFEQKRAELEEKAEQKLVAAQDRAAKINDVILTIEAMASEEGKLYGSVGPAEVCDAMVAKGHEIIKREVNMIEGPIHMIGEYTVELILHSDVTANFQVHVIESK